VHRSTRLRKGQPLTEILVPMARSRVDPRGDPAHSLPSSKTMPWTHWTTSRGEVDRNYWHKVPARYAKAFGRYPDNQPGWSDHRRPDKRCILRRQSSTAQRRSRTFTFPWLSPSRSPGCRASEASIFMEVAATKLSHGGGGARSGHASPQTSLRNRLLAEKRKATTTRADRRLRPQVQAFA